jgi:hypothetical protein
VDRLSLARLASAVPATTSRVDVYRRVLPGWILPVAACLALSFAGVVEALTVARGHVAAISGAVLGGGLLAGWSATPEQALWPCIVSLAFGAIVGVPAGLATSRATKWLRRRLKP